MVGVGMRPGGRAVGLVVTLGLMLAAVSPARGVVWSVQPTAVFGGMAGMSCPSARACIAVGEVGYKGPPGAMGWDGRRWTQESVPNPGLAPDSAGQPEALTGVSCPSSTACTAVGSNAVGGRVQPLAERWDGSRWSLEEMPEPAGVVVAVLSQVSCASPVTCVAVGSYTTSRAQFFSGALIARWDGVHWTVHTTPGAIELTSVSCSSSNACTAVGDSQSAT